MLLEHVEDVVAEIVHLTEFINSAERPGRKIFRQEHFREWEASNGNWSRSRNGSGYRGLRDKIGEQGIWQVDMDLGERWGWCGGVLFSLCKKAALVKGRFWC